MNKLLICIFSALIFMPIFNVNAENDVSYIYVSPYGNDDNDGSETLPLKSLEFAKEKAKNLDGTVEVRILGGEYIFSDTLLFSKEDKNIKFVGYGEDEVIFSGAEEITEFKDVTDEKILKLENFLGKVSTNNAPTHEKLLNSLSGEQKNLMKNI